MATRKGGNDSQAAIDAKDATVQRLDAMQNRKSTWIVYTVTAELTGPSQSDRDNQIRAFREALGIYEHHEHLITFEGTRMSGTLRTIQASYPSEEAWKASITKALEAHKIAVVAITFAIDELGTQIRHDAPSSEKGVTNAIA
jgi:hypothetical protein